MTLLLTTAPSHGWNWTAIGAVLVGIGSIATGSMALYTRSLAKKTNDVAAAGQEEAQAVVQQGKALQQQAAATAALAKSAAEQSRAAAEQLELTRRSLRASIQPWLTIGEQGAPKRRYVKGSLSESPGVAEFMFNENGEQLESSLALRNVGAGLAIIDPKNSHIVGWPNRNVTIREPMSYTSGRINNPVVPPNGQVYIEFVVVFDRWQIDFQTLTHQSENEGRDLF
jgi:hypothetical protein